jgi:methyl-accepting chemotaxis protein
MAAYDEMYAQGLQTGQAIRNILLNPSNPKAFKNFDAANQAFTAALSKANDNAKGSEDQDVIQKITDQWAADDTLKQHVRDLAKNGQIQEGIAFINEKETPAWRAVKATILAKIKAVREESKASASQVITASQRDVKISTMTIAGAFGMSFILVLAGLLRLSKRMKLAESTIERMGERGDLSEEIPQDNKDEVSLILTRTAALQGRMKKVVDSVLTHAEVVKNQASSLDGDQKTTLSRAAMEMKSSVGMFNTK